jgi:hypothetical protein
MWTTNQGGEAMYLCGGNRAVVKYHYIEKMIFKEAVYKVFTPYDDRGYFTEAPRGH